MFRLFSRFSRLGVASALALSATGFAAPPAAPAPVPVPYPNSASKDSASGLAAGKRMYKPVTSSSALTDPAMQQSANCAATNAQPVNQVSSDPEEGGQIAKAGKATGKASVHSFNFTHQVDKSSPMMMDSPGHGKDCH